MFRDIPLTSFKIELDSCNRAVRLDRFAREPHVPAKSVPQELEGCTCNAEIRAKACSLQQILPSLKSLVVKPACRCSTSIDGILGGGDRVYEV